jgi:hypothetical protein
MHTWSSPNHESQAGLSIPTHASTSSYGHRFCEDKEDELLTDPHRNRSRLVPRKFPSWNEVNRKTGKNRAASSNATQFDNGGAEA